MTPRLMHGIYVFGDWQAPNPYDPGLTDALHTARYNLKALTRAEAFRILQAAEAYVHFASHPTTTASVIAQLRELRRVVRENQREKP